jgi:hypothetical protein
MLHRRREGIFASFSEGGYRLETTDYYTVRVIVKYFS